MSVEIGILIAVIGCFVGLAGWLAGRDKKIANDSEWRGAVNTKLDTISKDVKDLCTDIKSIRAIVADHGTRITVVETKINEMEKIRL